MGFNYARVIFTNQRFCGLYFKRGENISFANLLFIPLRIKEKIPCIFWSGQQINTEFWFWTETNSAGFSAHIELSVFVGLFVYI